MPKLSEVFGIGNAVPTHTYVDRSGLDTSFNYHLGTTKHLVIHGPSKQGKTVLWKRNINLNQCITIRCSPTSTTETIFEQIFAQLGVAVPKTIESETKVGAQPGMVPGLSGEKSSKATKEMIGLNANAITYLSQEIRTKSKRIIIEDFHYLAEKERRGLAFHLKSLGEEQCFFIVIGVWPGQNLLTLYNGDLRGRVQEFDLKWTEHELKEVIKKGEEALNFKILDNIRDEIIADSYGNVGLLQRIMEKLCLAYGITQSLVGKSPLTITDPHKLAACKQDICTGEADRYEPFFELVGRGYRQRKDATDIYKNILAVCLDSTDAELSTGISYDQLYDRVRKINTKTTQSTLSQALNRITALQVEKNITPPVIYYNKDSRRLQIIEPEFLFYRKYGRQQP